MKSIKLMLILSLFIILVAGCTSVNKSHIYSPVGISINSELTADIDVDLTKKLTGSAKSTYLFGFIKLSGDSKYADGYGGLGITGKVKSAAAYDAINKSDGDILVSPQYIVKTNFVFPIKTVIVDVSGFEGKIKEIRRNE